MSAPILLDKSHAWGYQSPYNFTLRGENLGEHSYFRKTIYLNNGVNAASILLSPLAGIIRIIGAIVGLVMLGKKDPSDLPFNLDAAKNYCKMGALRGVLEILGLGIILGTVVDGYMTYKHHKDASLLQRV